MLIFQDEIEGSILYQELLDSAWKFYSENLLKKKRYEFINRRLKQINYHFLKYYYSEHTKYVRFTVSVLVLYT